MDRETLEQYLSNRKEILQLKEEIENLESMKTAAGIAKYNGMPSGGGGISDPTGDAGIALGDLRRRYEKRLREMEAQQLEIEDAIAYLEGDFRKIIRYRYIMGLKWEEICEKMGDEEHGPMDWSTVHRKHRAALKKLEEMAA